MTDQQQPGSDLELLLPPGALEKVRTGQIVKWEDLSALLAAPKALPVPARAPLPSPVTEAEQKAVERFQAVFNSIVPTEARVITPEEASTLIDERQVLDLVAKMAGARKDSIRTIFLNHVDKLVDEGTIPLSEVEKDATGNPVRDKDGHYMVKTTLVPEDISLGEKLSAEPRKGSTGLNLEEFQKICDDPEDGRATHQDYLDVTDAVRVLNPNKLMLKLRSKPAVITAVAAATSTGNGSITVTTRKI